MGFNLDKEWMDKSVFGNLIDHHLIKGAELYKELGKFLLIKMQPKR